MTTTQATKSVAGEKNSPVRPDNLSNIQIRKVYPNTPLKDWQWYRGKHGMEQI